MQSSKNLQDERCPFVRLLWPPGDHQGSSENASSLIKASLASFFRRDSRFPVANPFRTSLASDEPIISRTLTARLARNSHFS